MDSDSQLTCFHSTLTSYTFKIKSEIKYSPGWVTQLTGALSHTPKKVVGSIFGRGTYLGSEIALRERAACIGSQKSIRVHTIGKVWEKGEGEGGMKQTDSAAMCQGT